MAEVPGWYTEFVAVVVAQLPRDIDEPTAQGWLRNPGALEEALRGLLSGSAPQGAPMPAAFSYDKSAEGWELLEDVTEPAYVSGAALELAAFPQEADEYLLGDEMVDRVREIDAKLGQRHAEYLLNHPEEIPEDFRQYSLVFPGTVWRGRDGNHHVPCLIWRQGNWEMQFGILEAGVDSSDCLVRARA